MGGKWEGNETRLGSEGEKREGGRETGKKGFTTVLTRWQEYATSGVPVATGAGEKLFALGSLTN